MVNKRLDFSQQIFGTFPVPNKYTGEIGIEIEVEGVGLPKAVPSYWNNPGDGSLRGPETAEYVLKKPATRKTYGTYLDYLSHQFEKAGSKFDMSPRTSVHVHLNMQDKSLTQCYNLILCYLIVEDLLCHHAGGNRAGNLFCLRAHDAEYFVDWLAKSAKKGQFAPIYEQIRYTSINVHSILKFNSIEFRALRGTVDMAVIKEWVEMLLSLKDAAMTYTDPTEIMVDFSQLGAGGFLKKLLPEHFDLLKRVLPDWEQRLWQAVRLVQEIAYATDWQPPPVKKGGRLFVVDEEVEPEPDFNIEED